MEQNVNNSELNGLLNDVSKKLGASPRELKEASENGSITGLLKGLKKEDMDKIQKVLSNKDAANKILASEQAQKMLKNLFGK